MRKKVLLLILIIGLAFIALIISLSRCGMFYRPNTAINTSTNEELQTENQSKSEIESLIEKEVKELRNGKILYNIPQYMKVGESERIEVRIEKSTTDAFTTNLQGSGKIEINDIKVAPLMKVILKDEDNKFQVINISNAEQIVIDNSYTQWVWNVTPLKSGQAHLSINVSFKLNIPNQVDMFQEYILFDKQINVKVNPLFTINSFLTNNWQWLIGTILIPLAGYAVSRFLKRDKNEQK